MELKVSLKEVSYKVIIERGLLSKVKEFVPENRRVLIVSDDGVPFSYTQKVKNQFENAETFIFTHGEKNKNYNTYLEIIKCLIEKNFSRYDYLISLGGGVVGDLVGFAAMTYKRGIHFINIPTTTLSMVDSAIGGKTAINYQNIKNVVGGFHHPDVVLIDPDTLLTLPKRHFINGTIEALKVGVVGDKELYRVLKNTDFRKNYEEVIYRSLSYKIKLVEQDEKEENVRKLLNFGHTFGHAVESYYAMKNSLHGEAIGIGMLLVSRDKPYYEELKSILQSWKVRIDVSIDEDKIIELIKNDKKCNNDYIDLVIADQIGEGRIISLPREELRKYLRYQE